MATSIHQRLTALLLVVTLALLLFPATSFHAQAEAMTYVLDVTTDLNSFSQGSKADGDTEKAGTDQYFTIFYSAKTKIDSSNKTFDDGYAATQRINFGGSSAVGETTKNVVRFTTSGTADIKFWWVSGGDGREFALLNSDGDSVAKTNVGSTKNALYISTLSVDTAGTYYLAVPDGSNYLFKVEVSVQLPTTYTLDVTTDLNSFSQGSKADGDTEKAGTDQYFTIFYSTKTKIDSSNKTFDDGYAATQRINFGGSSTVGETTKNVVRFTTSGTADIKLWWVSGGDGREFALLNSDGDSVAKTNVGSTKNALYISTLSVDTADTYYLAVPDGSNYLFRLDVIEGGSGERPSRADWDTVSAPAITGISTENAGEISVTVDANVGYDGADELNVFMYDESGTMVTSKRSIAEETSHTLTFKPTASGNYTFKALLTREGEQGKESDITSPVAFSLPLGTPIISSATSNGGGAVTLVWNNVTEATSYNVYCNGKLVGTSNSTSHQITGLTIGEIYSFTVSAQRGDEEGARSTAMDAKATAIAQRVWSFTYFGPSTNASKNGYSGNIENDGSVTVFSEGGKGKIQPKDVDGLAFYYTAIPNNLNFTLRANIHVDSWTYSNGQEGFGLLAMDRVPEAGTATFWSNQYMAMLSKVEYRYDAATGKVFDTSSSEGVKYSMKLGLGVLSKLGITKENLPLLEKNDTNTVLSVANGFTYPLAMAAAKKNLSAGNYNIIGNVSDTSKLTSAGIESIENLTDFVIEIQRNNTGYFITYYDNDGNIVGQQKNYDPNALSALDSENVYIGFFAARNARATFTIQELSTIDPKDDVPAESKPTSTVEPSVTINSSSVTTKSDYTVSINSNVSGIAKISINGKVVAEAAEIIGGTRFDLPVKLTKTGKSDIVVIFTPDPDQDLGEDKVLGSLDPISISSSVTYNRNYENRANIYVSPTGSSNGSGSKSDPVDIHTAVANVTAGQTIILLEGTYHLNRTIVIERGIDGTAESPIRMVADPAAKTRPVLDFGGTGCEGITAVGSHWYFCGFDVTGTGSGKVGFHVCGHYNVLDQVNAYRNGNTGIQISRYRGSDHKSEWPSNNLILNCTSYGNADAGYEDADGFAAKLTIGENNIFDGCVAHHNADDGWDLYAKVETGSIPSVTIRNCVAYSNGYLEDGTNAGNGNGFKMGGSNLTAGHKLINCFAFFNKAKGIDSNSCPDIIVENCVSYNNESYNVAFYTNITQNTGFKANGIISFKDATIKSGLDKGENLKPKGEQALDEGAFRGDSNYYWNGSTSVNASGATITADMFRSLEFKGVARKSDGTIDLQGFLQLTEKAPANAGATDTIGTASTIPEITPETGDAGFMGAMLVMIFSGAMAICLIRKKEF